MVCVSLNSLSPPPSSLLTVFSPSLSPLSQQKKKKKKKDDDDDEYTQAPRVYLIFPEEACHKYQLRAYIYQARDLHGSDDTGLSGTCVCVCVCVHARMHMHMCV